MLRSAAVSLICLACLGSASAQAQSALKANPGAPPRVLLLVYQQFLPGKSGTRQSLETQVARVFDRLDVSATWIEMESLTGPPEALFFDPASSFEDIEKAGTALAQLYSTHAEVAQTQGEIMQLVASSRTVTAVRRDDLGPRANTIDLTKARYLALRVLHVPSGQEGAFSEAVKGGAGAQAVYEVNGGMPDGTYLLFSAMTGLKDLDQASPSGNLDSRFSGETNYYVIRPDMSHVTNDFAAGDPGFWVQKTNP
jgi:hypothetical protein